MARADCRPARALVATVVLTVACAPAASAQSRFHPYVGASLGSITVDSDDVDGHAASTGVAAGLTLSRFVDLEFEAVFPTGSFTRRYVGVVLYAPPPGTPREDVGRYGVISDSEWRREVLAVVSGVAIIHPPATGRVVPALVAGVTNQRARRIHRSIPIAIPAGVDPQHPAVPAARSGSRKTSARRRLAGSSRFASRRASIWCPTCATTTGRSATRSTTRSERRSEPCGNSRVPEEPIPRPRRGRCAASLRRTSVPRRARASAARR